MSKTTTKRRCPDCANLEQFCICGRRDVAFPSTATEAVFAGLNPLVEPIGRPTKVPYLRVIDGG